MTCLYCTLYAVLRPAVVLCSSHARTGAGAGGHAVQFCCRRAGARQQRCLLGALSPPTTGGIGYATYTCHYTRILFAYTTLHTHTDCKCTAVLQVWACWVTTHHMCRDDQFYTIITRTPQHSHSGAATASLQQAVSNALSHSNTVCHTIR